MVIIEPPAPSNNTVSVTLTNFPSNATKVYVAGDSQGGQDAQFYAAGTETIFYISTLGTIAVFCSQDADFGNIEVLGQTIKKSDMTWNSYNNSYYYTGPFTGTISGPFSISFVQNEPTATFDLSTLGLSVGTHLIQVKAKGDGYADSVFSNSVSYVVEASGYSVTIKGNCGSGETIYVQINDDPTWYYAQLNVGGGGFSIANTNIPNVYQEDIRSIGFDNVAKIKFGTQGNPIDYTGPHYGDYSSTGDFASLTFTSTGGSAPAYTTAQITMTQDSLIEFCGDD